MTAVVGDTVPGPSTPTEVAGTRRLLGGRVSIRTAVTPVLLVVATVVVWAYARSLITDFDRAQVDTILNRSFIQARSGSTSS